MQKGRIRESNTGLEDSRRPGRESAWPRTAGVPGRESAEMPGRESVWLHTAGVPGRVDDEGSLLVAPPFLHLRMPAGRKLKQTSFPNI